METPKLINHLHELTGLNFREVQSSNLYLVAYHKPLCILYVVFRDKSGKDPKWVYQYKVNSVCYREFLQARSLGHFFSEVIKEHVKCKSEIPY